MNVIREFEARMHPDSVPGFRRLISQARVGDPILLNERAMSRMVDPALWMLRRVGESGIRLTAAGYLPPAVVAEAMSERDWGWPVRVTRESDIRPIVALRTHLQGVGLLRISKGMLRQTVKGRALADSPRELWWHLAHTIYKSRRPVVSDATKLLLLFIATRSLDRDQEYMEALSLGLSSIGWAEADHSAPTPHRARELVAEKWRLLNQFGVFDVQARTFDSWGSVTTAGAAFARAALQSEAPDSSPR